MCMYVYICWRTRNSRRFTLTIETFLFLFSMHSPFHSFSQGIVMKFLYFDVSNLIEKVRVDLSVPNSTARSRAVALLSKRARGRVNSSEQ